MFAVNRIGEINRRNRLLLAIRVIATFIVCVGCQSHKQQLSYATLCGLSLEQIRAWSDSNVRDWLERVHGSFQPLNMDQLLPEDGKGHVVAYIWGDSPGYMGKVFLRDRKVIRFSQYNITQEVTFGEVVAYFGPPEWILKNATIREQVLYSIELDYPSQGISMGTTTEKDPNQLIYDGKLAIKLEENTRVVWTDCYRPSNIENVLRNDFFLSPEAAAQAMVELEHWPGFGAYLPLTK